MSRRTLNHILAAACLVLFAVSGASGADRHLLVEAESFDEVGGWFVDQQFSRPASPR